MGSAAKVKQDFCDELQKAPAVVLGESDHAIRSRADNLVLVKFGFSALSIPRFLAFSARFSAQTIRLQIVLV